MLQNGTNFLHKPPLLIALDKCQQLLQNIKAIQQSALVIVLRKNRHDLQGPLIQLYNLLHVVAFSLLD